MSTYLSRRQFLKIIAVGSLAGLGAKYILDTDDAPVSVQRSRVLMGTVINLTLVSEESARAEAALKAMFDRMNALEALLSHYRTDSQVSYLNHGGTLDDAHPALIALIQQAQTISELSGGAYDLTIKPLVDLYKQHASSGRTPTPQAIEATLQLVDYRATVVEGSRISFTKPGMALSLNSIGKGFIVDQGVAVLREQGFENVLVEAGGDLVATGYNPQAQAWSIGVQPPRTYGSQTTLNISNQAVATSGDYQQPFTGDLRQHHILDPRSGYSSPELASATIIAPTAAQADALATTVMVLGIQAGGALLQSLPECNGYLVGKDQSVYRF